MRDKISATLKALEKEKNIRILFAAESGSRAWGFASPDSDYDIRAIYLPCEDWYWTISESQKDTFEAMLPDNLDISAWELRKALRLFSKCNPAMNEWLGSPIVYSFDDRFYSEMKRLLPLYFNPIKATHHYLSLSQKAMDAREGDAISIKKLFYALRGLLAAYWVVHKQSMPPTEFQGLLTLDTIPSSILHEIEMLQECKSSAQEKFSIRISPSLNQYYEHVQKECHQKVQTITYQHTSIAALDALFKEMHCAFLR